MLARLFPRPPDLIELLGEGQVLLEPLAGSDKPGVTFLRGCVPLVNGLAPTDVVTSGLVECSAHDSFSQLDQWRQGRARFVRPQVTLRHAQAERRADPAGHEALAAFQVFKTEAAPAT